ncbi:MAG TPA: MMPL family transporter [Polyangia bacterium]
MFSSTDSRSARYCRFISRRAGAILIATLLLFAVAAFLASKLELKTAISELLPSDDPGVVALEKTQKRLGDMSLLLVGIRSPDRDANLRYADALTQKLQALPKSTLALATYHVRDLKAFFEGNKWLYVSEADLTSIRDRLRSEITRRKNPLLVDLSDDDEESVDSMRDRLTKQDHLGGRFPDGVFSNQDGSYVWIAALPPGGIFGEHGGEGIYQAATRLIRENDPHAFHPHMDAFVGGPVATAIATRKAVESDILWVTVTCLVIVAFSIALYFRRLRSLPLIATSAIIGTVMAFAVAELAFGYVNSSTAFLGSIIVGNGINYAIILMSRYEECRASGASTFDAMERAIAGVTRGTGVAAVCASAAYATLMLTKFRGFYQFGMMAAFGVLFCWGLTFTVLPAIFFLLDRRASAQNHRPARAPLSLSFLGRWIDHHPRSIAIVAVALTLFCSVGLLHFAGAPFEYDFRKLNANLQSSEDSRQFNQSMEKLFGRWPSPTIVLADNLGEVEAIRASIWRNDRSEHVIGQIVTINDVLPGTPESQTRKIALLRDIRKLTQDKALQALNEKERKQIAQIDIPEDLHLLTPADVPSLARRPFTEADGTIGRVVLVYPIEEHLSVWNGRDLLRIAHVLQYLPLPEFGKTLATSGSAVVFAGMIRSILHDGPLATGASLIVVLLFSFLIMRPRSAALSAIATLLVGVVWMVGIAGTAEVKITFLNFIALPITFGIGAEYGLNVAQRYRDDRDMVRAVGSTGAAVALCSWTTIVGYGSLLAASSRALRGFGLMAILGEVSCLAAALVAMPAIILWREKRRRKLSSNPR